MGLQIQPIIHFKNYCPAFIPKQWVGKIIIGINQKEITHWPEAVLQTTVDVEVIPLCIVL